jgi:hypothetical protein
VPPAIGAPASAGTSAVRPAGGAPAGASAHAEDRASGLRRMCGPGAAREEHRACSPGVSVSFGGAHAYATREVTRAEHQPPPSAMRQLDAADAEEPAVQNRAAAVAAAAAAAAAAASPGPQAQTQASAMRKPLPPSCVPATAARPGPALPTASAAVTRSQPKWMQGRSAQVLDSVA